MGRYSNKNRTIFDNMMSIYGFIFGLVGSIVFWVFIYRGDVYDNWYPLVGHFVSAHGLLIAITFHIIMRKTGKTFKELFKGDDDKPFRNTLG